VFEGKEPGSSEETSLPHPSAQHLAHPPGLGDERRGSEQQRTNRASKRGESDSKITITRIFCLITLIMVL
jgi:hypothetical protein